MNKRAVWTLIQNHHLIDRRHWPKIDDRLRVLDKRRVQRQIRKLQRRQEAV